MRHVSGKQIQGVVLVCCMLLEAVTQAPFNPSAVVSCIRNAEEGGAEDAALTGDVGVVEQVGGANVGGEGLLVVGLCIARQREDALYVGVEVRVPG